MFVHSSKFILKVSNQLATKTVALKCEVLHFASENNFDASNQSSCFWSGSNMSKGMNRGVLLVLCAMICIQ